MNEDAKTPVFLSHHALLGAVARRYLIHKEDVEDALQELFIRARENRRTNPQAKVSIINSTGNYFRGISVANDPALVKEIEKKVEEDKKLASNTVEEYSAGNIYTQILNIPGSNNKMINIGYTRTGAGSIELFVSGPPDAFK